MSAGISCEVYVDGNRLADTADEYLESTPTAMAGLKVTWGRSTVVDQPDASTCSFTVGDVGGDADFLSLLHVGHVVDVYAAAAVSSGTAPVDVTVDGSFETAAPAARVYVAGGTATADTANPAVDGRSIRVAPTPVATVAVPPSPFSTSPTAWNPVPQVAAGQVWTVTLQVALGGVGTGTIAVGLFPSPAAHAATMTGPPVTIPASSGYQTVTATWTIPAGAVGWVGAVLTTNTAPRWLDASGTWAAQTLTWQQTGATWIDDLHVLAPAGVTHRTMVFSGRITDLIAAGGGNGVQVDVTAVDRFADLGNDYIGDNPWLVQTISARVKRIIALAATPFSVDIATYPAGRSVTWVDIDSQAVAGLISELATTADAVLWSVFAANRGFYLWMEDPAQRTAISTLTLDGGSGLVVIVGIERPTGGVTISACYVAEDVRWEQDVSDVLSIVDLTWQEQTVDDQGQPSPTERHVVLTDPVAVAEFGQRRLGYSTQLVNATDGGAVAQRLLSRSRALGWKASGVTWDTNIPPADEFSDADRATAMTILNGAKRIGLPVVLTDMPEWTPTTDDVVPTYLEGGTYTFEHGRWLFEMTVSPSGLTGQSLKWNEVDPTYRWNQFSPSIRWVDMYGVGKAA